MPKHAARLPTRANMLSRLPWSRSTAEMLMGLSNWHPSYAHAYDLTSGAYRHLRWSGTVPSAYIQLFVSSPLDQRPQPDDLSWFATHGMIEELSVASKLLHASLEQYASACSAVHKGYAQANRLNDTAKVQQLLDYMDNELALVTSYGEQLKQITATISLVRNCHTRITPINILPDEILTRIFYLIAPLQPCIGRGAGRYEQLVPPKYPDWLSQVCSRWRQLAISSPALWSHIDLAPCHPFHGSLLTRATVFANRASHLPLHLHVISLEYPISYSDDVRDTLEEFLKSVGRTVKSLEVVAGDVSKADDECTDISILDSCLKFCQPGVLTRFTITNNANTSLYFIEGSRFDNQHLPDALLLDPSQAFLEELLDHVTALQLYGCYPHWTSQAYRNLAELRLISLGRSDGVSISESQLVGLLRSSPGLKVLHFDISITDVLPENASIEVVQLKDLAVLNLTALSFDQLGSFLRWLAPGSLPLQLSITGPESAEKFPSANEVTEFFARSNITHFFLTGMNTTYSQLSRLIRFLPSVRVVALDNLVAKYQSPLEDTTQVPQLCLDKLYFTRCTHDSDGLGWFLVRGLVRTVVLWRCSFSKNAGAPRHYVDQETAHDPFAGIVPVIRTIASDKPNPIDDWGL